jgi:predicted dithiol-disulfide oxidoreductase (DUF899 family)
VAVPLALAITGLGILIVFAPSAVPGLTPPMSGDWATCRRESPGMSAFALEDGVVYHTYSAYARGLDGLWGMYHWRDRAPRGHNETGP